VRNAGPASMKGRMRAADTGGSVYLNITGNSQARTAVEVVSLSSVWPSGKVT